MNLSSIRRLFAGQGKKEGPTVLLISGFGWSGSGAVIDYAMDFTGVEAFRKRAEETSLLKGRYSLGAIYRRALRGHPLPMNEVEEIATVLRGLPGSADAVEPRREHINLKRNEQMRREFGADGLDAAIERFLLSCRQLSDRGGGYFAGTPADLVRLAGELILELTNISIEARLRSTPSHLIINNDPAGYSVDLFPFHRNALYTIVTRDLRDVYADLAALKRIGDSETEVNRFCSDHNKKLDRFERACDASSRAVLRRTFIVDFSDFVSSDRVRLRWKQFSRINGEYRLQRFDPSVSIKNVGLGDSLDETIRDRIWNKAERERQTVLNRLRARNPNLTIHCNGS